MKARVLVKKDLGLDKARIRIDLYDPDLKDNARQIGQELSEVLAERFCSKEDVRLEYRERAEGHWYKYIYFVAIVLLFLWLFLK